MINKKGIESLLTEWLEANQAIDWSNRNSYGSEIQSLIPDKCHVLCSYEKPGDFYIIFLDDNERSIGVCEMYASSETFQWLQC
jgi:hypothetical protein